VKALAALALILGSPAMAAPMHYADFQKLVQPPAPAPLLAYGADPLQHVELWKPKGKGPFPVVLMLHGGCWQTAVAKADIMHMVAADLVKRGIAVWNVEYRGVDVPGGGYPGTFQDVAAAADMLGREGPKLGLDTKYVVAVGHSAGGHLAIWLSARPRIAKTSPLWSAHPLRLAGVVSLGGLPDLAQARTEAVAACGAGTVDSLVGQPTPQRPNVFSDTSPVGLLPRQLEIIQINGAEDVIAPPRYAQSFQTKASANRAYVTAQIIPSAGHFELITPSSDAWETIFAAIQAPFIVVTGAKPQPRPR
jgi:acetyl esterase/lipase